MRKAFLLCLFCVSLAISSCGPTVYRLTSDCDKITYNEMYKNIKNLLKTEGFDIIKYDTLKGYWEAEGMPSRAKYFKSKIETPERRFWFFQYNNGKIIAIAKRILHVKNRTYLKPGILMGDDEFEPFYCYDRVLKSWKWYWNVRNGLEKICGDKIIIVEGDELNKEEDEWE